ncbi:hypothetical protein CE497_25635, partial [Salmonella enterica subsp. enterica serovar Typhimurium]
MVVTLSVRLGIYALEGEHERELRFKAGAAMYHTKQTRRNGYHVFQPAMNMLARTRLQRMNDLWLALERR